LLSDVSRPNVILLAVMVAAFGTLVEADSWRGFDNFFLPAGLMIFLESHMNSPWPELVLLMGLFLLAIVIFLKLAPQFGISKHAARVYVISSFLLISVTALQNTVLPLLVFVFHAIAHRRNPCQASWPELDIVAGLAMASFAWLAIGLVADANALMFYGLMSVGMSVALVAISFGNQPLVLRCLAALLAGFVLLGVYRVLMQYNPTFVLWPGDLTAVCIGTIAVCAGVGGALPNRFTTHRAAKVTLLALCVPAVSYGLMFQGAAS